MQEVAEIVAWIKDYPSRPGAVMNEYSCLNLRIKANFRLISVSEYDHKWLRYGRRPRLYHYISQAGFANMHRYGTWDICRPNDMKGLAWIIVALLLL